MIKGLKNLLCKLGEAQQPTRIFQDKSEAIKCSTGETARYSSRRNHIDVRSNFIARTVEENGVVTEKIATNSMMRDLLNRREPNGLAV